MHNSRSLDSFLMLKLRYDTDSLLVFNIEVLNRPTRTNISTSARGYPCTYNKGVMVIPYFDHPESIREGYNR